MSLDLTDPIAVLLAGADALGQAAVDLIDLGSRDMRSSSSIAACAAACGIASWTSSPRRIS
jgi:hypothetical protein